MKALVLHGPGKYGTEPDWTDPESAPGWALVKVRYAGICGSDLPRFAGKGSYYYPIILGHEFCGTVERPAPGSEQFSGGENVAVLPLIPCGACPGCREVGPFHCENYQFLGSRRDGGFAEYCLVPERNCLPIPDDVDVKLGAFIEPLSVALHVAKRTNASQGARVLIFGAGTIGLLTGLWLKQLGASDVTIVDIRWESLETAQRIGFDSSQKRSGPDGFDVTIEASGSVDAFNAAIEKTKRKGTITVVGRPENDSLIPHNNFEQLLRKEITIRGCWGYDLQTDAHEGEQFSIQRMMAVNAERLKRLITHEISLEDAPEVITSMIRKEIYYCKVMIRV